jgi:hypothetical protein
MVMIYTVKSGDGPKVHEPTSMLAKLEEIFMREYQDAWNDTEKIKYLRYFNHVAAMRNRLEFNLQHTD